MTMLRWVGVSTPLLISLGVFVAPAFGTDHFNLESGIPITLEDIEPIEQGSVELQAFGRFLRLRSDEIGEAEPRVALGILEKTQLEIASPLLLGQGAANGNGDVQVSILRKLREGGREERWPGFATEADLELPTGHEGPGFKNRFDAGFTALVKKDLGTQAFHLNAGFEWTNDESDGETLRRVVWAIVAGHHTSLTRSIVLVSDLVWRQADDRHTAAIWLAEAGVRAQLSRAVIGAIGIGAGLNRGPETPALTVTLGFQIGL